MQAKPERKPSVPVYQPVRKERRSRQARGPVTPRAEQVKVPTPVTTAPREVEGNICDKEDEISRCEQSQTQEKDRITVEATPTDFRADCDLD